MNQKPKQKPKKQEPWNSFAYLGGLVNRKEPVILHLATNTLDDESQVKGVICGRELLVFRRAIRFIERVKGKSSV